MDGDLSGKEAGKDGTDSIIDNEHPHGGTALFFAEAHDDRDEG